MGFILFIVAVIIVSLLFGVGVISQTIYYLVTFKFKSGLTQIDNFFRSMAVSVDKFGNLACAFILNALLVKKGGMLHGEHIFTASYIIGRNKYKGMLTAFGRFTYWLVNKMDKGHFDKAIKIQKERDEVAAQRLTTNYYG